MLYLNTEVLTLSPYYYNAERHVDVQCPLHLHPHLEIIYVSEGQVVLNVNGNDRCLKAGQATFIMPYEQHSFATAEHSRCFVLVFSHELVADFYETIQHRSLMTTVFQPDPNTISFCEGLLSEKSPEVMTVKAVLYPMCREVRNNCEFSSAGRAPDKIFVEAVRYVQQQFETGGRSPLPPPPKHSTFTAPT